MGMIIVLGAVPLALLLGLDWKLAFIGGAVLASTATVVRRVIVRDERSGCVGWFSAQAPVAGSADRFFAVDGAGSWLMSRIDSGASGRRQRPSRIPVAVRPRVGVSPLCCRDRRVRRRLFCGLLRGTRRSVAESSALRLLLGARRGELGGGDTPLFRPILDRPSWTDWAPYR